MERKFSEIYWQKDRQKFLGKGERDLDAKDIQSLFRVRTDLSDLTPSKTVSCAFSTTYPEMNFAQACLVDGSIIIQDLNPQDQKDNTNLNNQVRSLNEISQNTIQVVDAQEQTKELIKLIKELGLKNPLYIFPGNGARVVSDYINNAQESLDISNSVYLPTTRTLIRPGKFRLTIDYTSLPENLPQNIIIVDDVITTGQTVDTLAFKLKLKNYKTNIVIASWIFLYGAFVDEDIAQTLASVAVKGNCVKNPPINSLSCLISPDAKYDDTKIAYGKKYFRDPSLFSEAMEKFK